MSQCVPAPYTVNAFTDSGLHLWLTLCGFVRVALWSLPTLPPPKAHVMASCYRWTGTVSVAWKTPLMPTLATARQAEKRRESLSPPKHDRWQPRSFIQGACLIFHKLLSAPKQGGKCTQEKWSIAITFSLPLSPDVALCLHRCRTISRIVQTFSTPFNLGWWQPPHTLNISNKNPNLVLFVFRYSG